MKQLSLIIFALITFGITACKDDAAEKSNYSYENNKYILEYGSIQRGDTNFSHTPNTYNFKILLGTKAIKYDESLQKYTGIGSYLFFNIISSDSDNPTPGSFVFDGFASGDSLTFDRGFIGINHDISDNTTGERRNIKTGIVNLRRNGNIFILDFQLYTSGELGDEIIKGFYNGYLSEVPYKPEE